MTERRNRAGESRVAATVVTRRSSWRRAGEDGTVTAEAAIVLPIIAAFALTLMWMLTVGIAKVETVDAARDAARAIARGDDPAAVVAAAARIAPPDAVITIDEGVDGLVTVTVAVDVQPPGWLVAPLPSVTLGSEASTLTEQESP
jgi:hypothetical protein